MKFRFPFTLALLFSLPLTCPAAEPVETPVKAVMQAKLQDAQSLLGSVSTGDFPTMAASASHLVELANLTSWYSSQNPMDQLLLNNFRRNADALVKAAEKKNLDAASLAYVQLTFACFDCHKHLRETRLASIPNFDRPGLAGSK